MKIADSSRLGALCGLAAAALPCPALADAKPGPNILFVFTDDHAAHAIGAYGSKINKTPHLDRLAKQGMLFRNCFCTNSICAPSRAVILTGKHSHLNGVIDNRQPFDGTQQHIGRPGECCGIGRLPVQGRFSPRIAPRLVRHAAERDPPGSVPLHDRRD